MREREKEREKICIGMDTDRNLRRRWKFLVKQFEMLSYNFIRVGVKLRKMYRYSL